MAKLTGKVALITGAAVGLGEGIATAYAKYGAKLCMVDLSPEVEKTAEKLRKEYNAEIVTCVANVADPEQMKASIRRLVAQAPATIRIAHYGAVTECARLAGDLVEQVDRMTAIAREADDRPDRHARIVEGLTQLYVERAHAHGIDDAEQAVAEVLGGDIEINAQGLEAWLERLRKASA